MVDDSKTRPLIGVGVIVFRDDTVLLIRRGKEPKTHEWSIPGGRQRLGEPVLETARREVWEETGVEIDICGFVDVIDFIDADFHYTLLDYAAGWLSGDVRPGGDVLDARWVPLADLADYDLWEETQRVIAKARDLRDAR